MARRDYLLGITALAAGVALTQWINVRLLCRGDPRFDAGCSGVALYAGDELVALAPAVLLAFGAILASGSTSPRRLMWFAVALALIGGGALELGNSHRWPGTGGGVLVAAAVFAIIRLVARRPVSRIVTSNERRG